MKGKKIVGGYTISKTLSQIIYNHLKESIITNKLKAGQKINERKIAELCEVSITPVKEAVFMLGAEGLVKHWDQSSFHPALRRG